MAKPLTKVKRSGKVYTRPPSIDANIDSALGQDLDTLKERLKETDRRSPDYLTSECLVHLYRDSTRREDHSTQDTVVLALLSRCEAVLRSKVSSGMPGAEQLREEILGEFALILANDGVGDRSEELDYYECRFNRAFRTLRIDMVRKERKIHEPLATLPSEASDPDEGTLPQDVGSCRPTQADRLARDELLDALPPDVRKAVVLCHEMGYEVESADPTKTTAATICGVTGRTIRNRLNQARELISQTNQEEI